MVNKKGNADGVVGTEKQVIASDLVKHGKEVVLAVKQLVKIPNVIENMEQYRLATDAATVLSLKVKNATTAMKYFVDPKMQEVKEIKSKFASFIDPAMEMLDAVKARMKIFLVDEQARKDEEQKALEVKAMAEAPADAETVTVPVVNNIKTQHGALGTSTVRKIKKWRVVDEAKIPRAYLMTNDAEITKAMRLDVAIPGIEFYEDASVAIRIK